MKFIKLSTLSVLLFGLIGTKSIIGQAYDFSISSETYNELQNATLISNNSNSGQFPDRGYSLSLNNYEEPVWYLNVDSNVQLYVKEIGKGDTIVVVHGGFGAEHSYLIRALKDLFSKYHFVFYDQRGSLRSPAPDSVISVSNHVEDIERLRKELKIDKLNLLGHSMGTFLCGYYASRHHKNVRSMTLLALVYPKTPETDSEKRIIQAQQKQAGEFFNRAAIDEEIKEEGLDRDSLNDKEKTSKWRIGFAGTNIFHIEKWRQVEGGQVFYSQSAGSAAGRTLPGKGWNFIPLYDSLEIPITVLNGYYDFSDMEGRMYKNWLADIDNLEYVLIDSAGHNAWIDRPVVFGNKLEEALRKISVH